jgi:hypothetical protein
LLGQLAAAVWEGRPGGVTGPPSMGQYDLAAKIRITRSTTGTLTYLALFMLTARGGVPYTRALDLTRPGSC